MALKSMKITKADRTAKNKSYESTVIGSEDYPYGLRINLDEDMLKKLGIKKMPKTGGHVSLKANCCVTSVSMDERNGKTNRRIELQIEEMDIVPEEETAEEAIFDDMPEEDEED
jgi:hypothetical protein